MFRKLLSSQRGEGYIDIILIILIAMIVITLALKVFPVFIVKQQLNAFATELCRTAEVAGQIGNEIEIRKEELQMQTGISPVIMYDAAYIFGTNKVQLNNKIEITLKTTVDIGLFGSFASFPIDLTAKATGRSEVFWK